MLNSPLLKQACPADQLNMLVSSGHLLFFPIALYYLLTYSIIYQFIGFAVYLPQKNAVSALKLRQVLVGRK